MVKNYTSCQLGCNTTTNRHETELFPEHAGIPEDETVDKLAKEVIKNGNAEINTEHKKQKNKKNRGKKRSEEM